MIQLKLTIDKQYLNENPNHIFVFGDNTLRKGKGGAAKLRDCTNTWGFITKKYPSNLLDKSFYRPDEYKYIYFREIARLIKEAKRNPDKIYLISRLGAGLANKYCIFEEIIQVRMKEDLKELTNIIFLW